MILLGLAFGHHNVQILTSNKNESGQLATQTTLTNGINPEGGVDPDGPGNGGSTGGNTGQNPPPFTNP